MTQSAPAGREAPVMISMQFPLESVNAGSPAAWVAWIGKFRKPLAKSACAIAMPSIVTRSKGGWSLSAVML